MRVELKFVFPVIHVTELIVLGKRVSSGAVYKFIVFGENVPNK